MSICAIDKPVGTIDPISISDELSQRFWAAANKLCPAAGVWAVVTIKTRRDDMQFLQSNQIPDAIVDS
jgi:hypothetical protein